eukprot:TRINITY_DN18766_c0_g1_i1.p1 TRINITY_DN18766_c0_g1~~TRINITY_DN18766_c0_g1_i1.p1  ORF type:complete len:341 (+),score=75.44 TRINITY_DN18766_c0_g1_i1:51-1073(+)
MRGEFSSSESQVSAADTSNTVRRRRRIMEEFKKLDVYSKTIEEVSEKTDSGAVVSILTYAVIIFLVVSETSLYLQGSQKVEFTVDKSFRELLQINVDVEFPYMPCGSLSLDVMDISGNQQNAVSSSMSKLKLDEEGRVLGHESKDDPREIGCRIKGFFQVKKVSGNFHIAVGQSYSHSSHHMHDVRLPQLVSFNASHIVHRLSFGDDFPGVIQPLDGTRQIASVSGQYQYYTKVVPTEYHGSWGRVIQTNQYSVTDYFRPMGLTMMGPTVLPGVFFWYDFNPIRTILHENSVSFVYFITSLCATIGGVFTVAGLLDSVIYRAYTTSKRMLSKNNTALPIY